jgi:hypothetical protein
MTAQGVKAKRGLIFEALKGADLKKLKERKRSAFCFLDHVGSLLLEIREKTSSLRVKIELSLSRVTLQK